MGEDKEKENYWDDRVKSLKEIPSKRVKKRVTQRTKKGPISVENFFSPTHRELKGVMLKVTAIPEDWKKIELFALDHPDWFGLEFHSHFATPAVLEINEKNRVRGAQKKIYYFVNDIKIHAGALYAFFKYWCGRPVKQWPKYLNKLIEVVKKEDRLLDIKTTKGDYNPAGLTEFCIDKIYGEAIHSLGLTLFSDPSNFYLTYIQDQKRPKRITEMFIKGKTPQEIANLTYSIPALNFVFRALQVL